MSIFLVLDALLVLLVVLFMPIGFWRGPVKEALVTLGILSGVVLADYWARPWGHDLSTETSITADGGAFIVAMIFLIAATFVLGYGLGSMLAPGFPGTYARALGAVVAALNGMLLLSYALQYVRLFLLSSANEKSLSDSFIARFLLNDIAYVLLGAALLVIPLVLYVLITGRRAYEIYDDDYLEDYDEPALAPVEARRASAPTQTLPPRVPVTPLETAGVYKAEPVARARGANDATRQLQVAEPRITAEPTPATDDAVKMEDTDPHIVIPSAATPTAAPPPTATEVPAAAAGADLAPGYARCTVCHAVLGPDTSICPNCGTLR